MRYTIVCNRGRYPGIEPELAAIECFDVEGLTLEQAELIADRLSNHNAGCDYSWYVEGETFNG